MKVSKYEYQEIIPPKKYQKIWDTVNLSTQMSKAKAHGLVEHEAHQIFKTLSKRGYYLATVAEYFGCKTIVEVGTAKGYQFYSFAEYCKNNGGHVYSCDISDERNEEYKDKYNDYCTFVRGDSRKLATHLINEQVDLFYLDGDHSQGSVLSDVKNLSPFQSKNPVWVFDDYDRRFGCYKDISSLLGKHRRECESQVYFTGKTASGGANHQAIIRARL